MAVGGGKPAVGQLRQLRSLRVSGSLPPALLALSCCRGFFLFVLLATVRSSPTRRFSPGIRPSYRAGAALVIDGADTLWLLGGVLDQVFGSGPGRAGRCPVSGD